MQGLAEDVLKRRLANRGVIVPRGVVVETGATVIAATAPLAFPIVAKGLVPVTDRAKRGLIHIVDRPEDLPAVVEGLLAASADGHHVRRVLLEERCADGDEHYLGASFDHARGVPVLLHGRGGSGIEHREPPEQLRLPASLEVPDGLIDPRLGLVAAALLREFAELKALLLEANPVRLTADGAVVLDAKATLDPTAPVPEGAIELSPTSESEVLEVAPGTKGGATARLGELGGDIGLVSAGGGVLSVVLDALRREGLSPANFSDVSAGTATDRMLGMVAERVADLRPRAVLVTSGITSSVAVTALAIAVRNGLAASYGSIQAVTIPVVARLAGEGEGDAAGVMAELPHCIHLGRDHTIEDAVAELAHQLNGGPRGDLAR